MIELVVDLMVNCTVNNIPLKTLSLVVCMEIRILSLRVHQLI